MWLARRLANFSALHPEIAVNAIIQLDEPDFVQLGIDLAIVHVPHVPETALRPGDLVLMHEEVYPVCSPDLYPLAAQRLDCCRLLQEAHDGSPELGWHNWSATLDLPCGFETKIVHYSTFGQAIGAALGGAGIALGRSPLIDPELASGRLVRLFPGVSQPASWRFVLRPGPTRQRRMVKTLIDFLRGQVARDASQ
jgi:LysR family transcriptional regulator, glycine cleavage system transcriptional activator